MMIDFREIDSERAECLPCSSGSRTGPTQVKRASIARHLKSAVHQAAVARLASQRRMASVNQLPCRDFEAATLNTDADFTSWENDAASSSNVPAGQTEDVFNGIVHFGGMYYDAHGEGIAFTAGEVEARPGARQLAEDMLTYGILGAEEDGERILSGLVDFDDATASNMTQQFENLRE